MAMLACVCGGGGKFYDCEKSVAFYANLYVRIADAMMSWQFANYLLNIRKGLNSFRSQALLFM
jgi:hypothetical protein